MDIGERYMNIFSGWDEYFMTMVYLIAMKSKDPSSKLGAVIVGKNNEILSTGYNGFVRNVDDEIEERYERPEKYHWFEHAERNAIYNAARNGISLNDTIMYTNGTPCSDCCRAIIQSGLKTVIVHDMWDNNNSEKWGDSAKRSRIMLSEAKINLRIYDGNIISKIICLQNGIEIKF